MPSSAEMVCVAPDDVVYVWPFVEGMLRVATERCGDWTIAGLKDALCAGALLWIVLDEKAIVAAAITRLLRTPHGLVCHVVACGGGGGEWPQRLRQIEKYAADEGCARMRIDGRNGWSRVFRDYEVSCVTLEKRLS